MFQPGDRIVHPLHGAGVIGEIVEQKVGGESVQYYVLQISPSSIRVMVPVIGCENIGIRAVVDAETAFQVIDDFQNIEMEDNANWNKRYRENMVRLKSGRLGEVCRVVKSLMQRDQKRGLSTGERKMLNTAKQILLSELVMATQLPYETLEEKLQAAL